jgi:hypothetical protein
MIGLKGPKAYGDKNIGRNMFASQSMRPRLAFSPSGS